LSGTYPNPAVAKITETSGPTSLTIGTVADGQFLKRSGSTLVSSLGFTKIYDNTLSSAGNFDTGAASIPSGYSAIQIVLMGRGTVSSPQVDNLVRLNNDSGSSYLDLAVRALNASTVNAVADAASTSAEFGQVTAGTGTANYAGVVTGLIVGYDQTTFFKQCSYTASFLKDTTPSGGTWAGGFIWISTAAITRIAVTASGTTYVTGTRLIVYGLP
jgi:hypothetical protein